MLSKLLELLQEGGTRRIDDLARELGTTPQLIEVMLEDLARRGYLRRITARCPDLCTQCSRSDMCAAGGSSTETSGGQIWVLTEKKG